LPRVDFVAPVNTLGAKLKIRWDAEGAGSDENPALFRGKMQFFEGIKLNPNLLTGYYYRIIPDNFTGIEGHRFTQAHKVGHYPLSM
jgi:hypothetical protein